VFIYML